MNKGAKLPSRIVTMFVILISLFLMAGCGDFSRGFQEGVTPVSQQASREEEESHNEISDEIVIDDEIQEAIINNENSTAVFSEEEETPVPDENGYVDVSQNTLDNQAQPLSTTDWITVDGYWVEFKIPPTWSYEWDGQFVGAYHTMDSGVFLYIVAGYVDGYDSGLFENIEHQENFQFNDGISGTMYRHKERMSIYWISNDVFIGFVSGSHLFEDYAEVITAIAQTLTSQNIPRHQVEFIPSPEIVQDPSPVEMALSQMNRLAMQHYDTAVFQAERLSGVPLTPIVRDTIRNPLLDSIGAFQETINIAEANGIPSNHSEVDFARLMIAEIWAIITELGL